MAETAFTPAPWRVDPMYPGDIQSGDGSLELACTAAATLHAGEKPAQEFQLANARLIAAAPELFEALEKCRDKFRHYHDLHVIKCTAEGDEKADRNREMADMCDAILAKARATS